jgi:3-hydroxyisobutyrate dehydrogenase-like beta-hydroxyacid dehydrogenase
MTVAFIGTGSMGRPMLRNLVTKGFLVVAYDVAPQALDAAARLGAAPAESAAAASARGDLVITMLPSSSHVESAYLGPQGMCKDLGLAVNAARELRVPVAASAAAQQVLRMASSQAYGKKVVASVYAFLKASGVDAPV